MTHHTLWEGRAHVVIVLTEKPLGCISYTKVFPNPQEVIVQLMINNTIVWCSMCIGVGTWDNLNVT